jgi:hypothetical protein
VLIIDKAEQKNWNSMFLFQEGALHKWPAVMEFTSFEFNLNEIFNGINKNFYIGIYKMEIGFGFYVNEQY